MTPKYLDYMARIDALCLSPDEKLTLQMHVALMQYAEDKAIQRGENAPSSPGVQLELYRMIPALTAMPTPSEIEFQAKLAQLERTCRVNHKKLKKSRELFHRILESDPDQDEPACEDGEGGSESKRS